MPRWLPNAISGLRIVLVPVWLALAVTARDDRGPALLVLVALGATDVLDGFIARRFDLATNLGATLDAVADKLAQITTVTFLAFAAQPLFTPLPLWLWGALLLRDGVLGVGWVVLWRRHRHVEAEHRWHGRLSSLWLFALVVAATAGAPPLGVNIAAAVAVALVFPSTVAYLQQGSRQLRLEAVRWPARR